MSKQAYWEYAPKNNKGKAEAEFSSTENVNWLKPENVTAIDSEGKKMLCKCGKPITVFYSGKTCFESYCADCNPYWKKEVGVESKSD